ncbi:hypothetical protein RhiirC2_801309 [Rhizophagus irregularis]|uniref:Uncharacterized protein n=1 Tax=Rhizophagus irregularis TaxID=588596 RepID=A0A2N1M2M4_9GLOM|nr:hypothetical protein RhiirC2_801309 [Rhizophagus irregularis]
MSMDKSQTPNEEALDFISKFNKIYFQTFTHHLKVWRNSQPCELHFTSPSYEYTTTTFSLIYSIALYAASRSWDNFSTQFFCNFGDMGDDDDDNDDESQNTDDYLMESSTIPQLKLFFIGALITNAQPITILLVATFFINPSV